MGTVLFEVGGAGEECAQEAGEEAVKEGEPGTGVPERLLGRDCDVDGSSSS